jgi:hypothetical protein
MLLLKHRLKGRCATALRDYIYIRLYMGLFYAIFVALSTSRDNISGTNMSV